MNRNSVLAIAMLATLACGSAAYSLRDANNNEVAGIPFFPVVPSQAAVTTYEQTWIEMSMSFLLRPDARSAVELKKTPNVLPPSGSSDYKQTVTRYLDASYANDIRTAFDSKSTPSVAFDAVYARFAGCQDNNGKRVPSCTVTPPGVLPIASVLTLPRVAHDEHIIHTAGISPLYINSVAPFGGSTNAAFQFGSDGTLTSATSQVQDLLPPAIASAIGSVASTVATGLTSSATTSTGATNQPQAVGQPWVVSGNLTQVAVTRLYTLTIIQRIDKNGALIGRCGDAEIQAAIKAAGTPDCTVRLTVQMMRGDQPPPAPSTPPSVSSADKGIQFSGTVVLPTASAAASPSGSLGAQQVAGMAQVKAGGK
jgi:hypothetical protein